MRVLVTGGAGYVGSRVTAHLLACGFDITVFDRLVYGGQSLLSFAGTPSFRLIKGDVRDRCALTNAMQGHDAIVHLAAIVGEAACDINPSVAEEVNRDAAIETHKLAQAAGLARFIFVSTCSNYGISEPNTLADESSELRPLSLYARTKVDVERYILTGEGALATTILRLGTICGLSARMRFDLLVSEMARAAALGQTIDIYKAEAWRPFLHVGDAGRIVRHVLEYDSGQIAGRVFNVVGENYQKAGLIDLVRRHFPNAVIRVREAAPDLRDYRVSSALVERDLGFAPLHTVEQAFVETAHAVSDGVFLDPFWPGHSAIPLAKEHLETRA